MQLKSLPARLLLFLAGAQLSRCQPYVTDPIARHTACAVNANTPTVCLLAGHVTAPSDSLDYYILTLPEEGWLYETSPNFRSFGSAPLMAPEPITAQLLPLLVTDPKHQVVYVPPTNKWPTPNAWSMFTYVVEAPIERNALDQLITVRSEPGLVVLTNPERQIAGSDFHLANNADGWTMSGQLEVMGGNAPSEGVRHQALAWGGLSHYIYGVDEVQSLDFATGTDLAKWYFEASPGIFHRQELATAYGGYLRFRVRSQYGNFLELNDPLDWVTIECQSCDTGHGARIIRFLDDTLRWIGNEAYMEFHLHENGRWSYDPLNSAQNFTYATRCQIAAILTNVSRLAILGDFTRGGEGIAIDDVSIIAAEAALQPAYPLDCQQGCICQHNSSLIHPTCC